MTDYRYREDREPPPWSLIDSIALSISVVVAAALRFWHLGIPAELVYDEKLSLAQAGSLTVGWPPPHTPHPPVAKELMTLGIWVFGNYPWAWRAANALVGTGLVAITYLLGRRLYRSRLAASMAAAFICIDGMFLVASRVAMINIVYVTLAALAFLLLFRFAGQSDPHARRRTLGAIGLVLGLCIGAKAAISEVAALLVAGGIAFVLLDEARHTESPGQNTRLAVARIMSAYGLLAAIMFIVFIASFSPWYWYGWWNGIGDLVAYHRWALHTNLRLPSYKPTSSPFWTWPLLLRPYAYWKRISPIHTVSEIWSGGNPLLWWGILAAIPIAIARGFRQRNTQWVFPAVGYIAYMAMWIPIRRFLFIYDYMPAAYVGLLALAGALAECWNASARRWEQIALLLPLAACLILGWGILAGGAAAFLVALAYLLLARSDGYDGRFVCGIFCAAAIGLCIYFFPLWTAIPMTEPANAARIWLHGKGLANWM